MSQEEQLRREAVRRRLEGQSPSEVAVALGRTTRWVRKWVARHADESHDDDWAQGRSRAPKSSPTKTPTAVEAQILAARERLAANPQAQFGSLAIRRVGVDPIPPARGRRGVRKRDKRPVPIDGAQISN